MKTALKIQRMFIVILFLISIFQITAYSLDEKQLSKVVLSGDEDDFYGNCYWPYGSAEFGSAENAFMSWERIDENNVGYFEGYLYFVSRNDRIQIDEVGAKDSIELDLTYDLDEMKVTGSLNYYTITTMDFDKYQAGEGGDWLNYANPQWHSKSAIEVVCEVWMDFDIDWELDPDNPRFLEKTVPVDVTFHAKVLRYGNPQDEADEKYEEKTVIENLPVTVRITMYNYAYTINPMFGFWSYAGADYASSPSISGTFECSSDPCSNIKIEWNEPTSETETTTPAEEEESISEVNVSEPVHTSSTIPSTTEPSTTTPVSPPDSDSSIPFFGSTRGLLAVSGVAAAGFGLTWLLRRRSLSNVAKGVLKGSSPTVEPLLKEKTSPSIHTGTSDSMPEIKPSDNTVPLKPIPEIKTADNLPFDPNAEIKPQVLIVDPPDPMPEFKTQVLIVDPPDPMPEFKTQVLIVDPPDIPEIKLGGASVPSEVTEMVIEDKQFSNEGEIDIESTNLDGTIDSSNLSLDGSEAEISLETGSRVKVDVDPLPHEDTVAVEDATLSLEGDSKGEEAQDITKSEIKGNVRVTLGTRIEDSGSLAVSSDSQIDIKKDTKSDVQTQKKEAQDRAAKKTDDPDAES